MKRYRTIVFFMLAHKRIGHIAINTDIFLRRLRDGYFPKDNVYIGVCAQPPANQQLVNMYKRRVNIIESNLVKDVITVWPINGSEFFYALPYKGNEYSEFEDSVPIVHFTDEEKDYGARKLREMGIGKNDWFVCFHSRDPEYLNRDTNNKNGDWEYNDFRNSDISNYLKAAEYVADQGGYAIRIGSIVEKPLPLMRHPRIIDYATDFRSDFMDIFLIGNCKFLISDNCGVMCVAHVFNVPTAAVNVIPLKDLPFLSADKYIPKRLWSRERGRLLTFKEMVESCFDYGRSEQYRDAGIEIEENSSDDILGLTVEMLGSLNGRMYYTVDDERLQSAFRSLFKQHHSCYKNTARIGAHFLMKNRALLEGSNFANV